MERDLLVRVDDVIELFSRWRRWKRRWRRCFARKLRRSTQRYKKETGAKNNLEYVHTILDKPAFGWGIVWVLGLLGTKRLRA